jgi:hypothetical protein
MLKLKWTDNGGEWMSETIAGEIVPARIKVSSKNSDGTYSYFCYRNARALAVTKSLEDAKTRCEKGGDPATDSVLEYVKNNPGELPPFLALSETERKAIRGLYPHAAPAAKAVVKAEAKVDRGVMPPEPKMSGALREANVNREYLAKKLAERMPPNETPMMPMPPEDWEVEAAPREGLNLNARMSRIKDGNPKKVGSAAFVRWKSLLEYADKGATVGAWILEKDGRKSSVRNAVAKGYIKLEGGE